MREKTNAHNTGIFTVFAFLKFRLNFGCEMNFVLEKKPPMKALKLFFANIFNPKKLWSAWQFKNEIKKIPRASSDAQLKLYSQILPGDFLHYGYFEDTEMPPEEISINDIYRAQLKYAQLFLGNVCFHNPSILDVGCGMGGITNLLQQSGLHPTALTPDKNQINYIKSKYPDVTLIEDRFENLDSKLYKNSFGSVINSESLQYINLDQAIDITKKILIPNGRWLIADYFRMGAATEKSGHLWKDFIKKIDNKTWRIISQQNITANTLVTLKYIHMFANNIGLPIYDFIIEKFKLKNPFWYSLAGESIDKLTCSIQKNIAAIDPQKFAKEKQYLFLVLEKIE